jgi:hypothetical protein
MRNDPQRVVRVHTRRAVNAQNGASAMTRVVPGSMCGKISALHK